VKTPPEEIWEAIQKQVMTKPKGEWHKFKVELWAKHEGEDITKTGILLKIEEPKENENVTTTHGVPSGRRK
jgi:hypothetical protein